MPISGQIIPKYLHPHVETYINDNTTYVAETATIEDGIKSLHVFTSDKGRDGQVLIMNSLQDFYNEYGTPNFKKHGQPNLMPYATLAGGYGSAYCMRVMPEDACYSALVYAIRARVSNDEGEDKLIFYPITFPVAGLNNSRNIESAVEAAKLSLENPDEVYPLMAFYSQGRGVYGNNFRIRMVADSASNKNADYFFYMTEVYVKERTSVLKEIFNKVSLLEDAYSANSTLFVDDIIEDGSTNVFAKTLVNNIEELMALYNDTFVDNELSETRFDILNFKNADGTYPKGVELASLPFVSGETIVTFADINGLALDNGTDGNIAETIWDEYQSRFVTNTNRQNNINTLFANAFTNKTSPIRSKRRVPVDLIMDANYDNSVKDALRSFITSRGDAYGIMDAGIKLNTAEEVIAWAASDQINANRLYGKECQHYTIRDPFTGKKIVVTTTYYLALRMPWHFKTNGRYFPFTGERFALLTGAIKNTVKPVIDADDLDVKESLYNARVNYFETIAEDTIIRGVQTTSQSSSSDLSEENNMLTLLQMKREVENMVASLTYNFAEAEDRKRFTDSADRLLSKYRGTACRDASVSFDVSPYEEDRNIIHCYISVVFRSLVKTGIIEVDINPRSTSTAE